jgi:type IX secretion system PorP/SprF family membrane protein
MKTKIILLLLIGSTSLFAQRQVQYGQYLFNPMAINPAMAGSAETFRFNAIFRRQWIQNIQGLPLSQTFAIDGKIGGSSEESRQTNDRKNFFGLGLQGLLDRTGLASNTAISANIAYHYQLSETQRLSVGLSGGINTLPIFDAASGQIRNKALGSFGAGINYQSDLFWLGLSMPEILNSYANATNQSVSYVDKPIFVHGGLNMQIADDIGFKTSFLLSQKGEYHVNAQAIYQDKIGALLSYRSLKSGIDRRNFIHGMITYNLTKNVMIGYSYSSRMAENPLNDREIHELAFTFIPNPK